MPCYVTKFNANDRRAFEASRDLGYTGTLEEHSAGLYGHVRSMFLCGDFGPHCTDCMAPADVLCDYPVGDGKTCDRNVCEDHAHEVAPDIHYCECHYQMWRDFRDSGGVDESLRNVIAFKAEK